jgi:hypothetical protein
MMLKALRVGSVIAIVLAAPAWPLAAARGQVPNPAVFDSVLTRFVRDGWVDYAALKANREQLDRYLAGLAAVTEARFRIWSEAERIAYLINAYNAYTLETAIDHYPIRGTGFFEKLIKPKRFAFPSNSIRHIDGVFDGITHRVMAREMTLDGIEHSHLRAEYDEPRIHFALVCAAVSCPPLRGEAYRGERLDEQLDDQGRRFLNDPRLNRFDLDSGEVHLSRIFDWFGDDFRSYAGSAIAYEGDESIGGVLSFISRYLPARVVDFLKEGEYEVDFMDYDWTLNDQAVAAAR